MSHDDAVQRQVGRFLDRREIRGTAFVKLGLHSDKSHARPIINKKKNMTTVDRSEYNLFHFCRM